MVRCYTTMNQKKQKFVNYIFTITLIILALIPVAIIGSYQWMNTYISKNIKPKTCFDFRLYIVYYYLTMQIKESTIQYNGESMIADIIGDDSQIDILMIHWWGLGSNRKRFHGLRLDLAKHGITSVAFDHLWHGDSSWNLLWSTLKSRTEQVEIIANELSGIHLCSYEQVWVHIPLLLLEQDSI